MPTVDDVGKAAAGLRSDAVAWIAAIFLVGFFSLLVWYLKSQKDNAAKLEAVNTDRLRLVEEHTRQLLGIYQGKRPARARLSRKDLPPQLEATDAEDEKA